MKRISIGILGFFLLLSAEAFADVTTVNVSIGTNFFDYSKTALETSFGIIVPIQEGLSVEGKASYAVQPSDKDVFMAVPLQAGVRFSFDSAPYAFHCSIGMEPVFVINPDSFRMGPYLGLEGSLRVHPFLQLYIAAEQNLLFGGEDYVSTGTRLAAGFRFAFSK